LIRIGKSTKNVRVVALADPHVLTILDFAISLSVQKFLLTLSNDKKLTKASIFIISNISNRMPSAAQIRARKAFVKKYAKKGKRSKSTKPKKSKFAKTGKKKDMIAGVDYYKSFDDTFGIKPKSKKLSQKLKKEMRY